MRRILLDENIPVGLKGLLSAYDVATADEMGWVGITNGELLDAAERDGFAIMITADRNIRAQQRLVGARSRSSSSRPITGTRSRRMWRRSSPPATGQRRGLTSWCRCPELSAAGDAGPDPTSP
jgi:hypothetical protein